MPDPELFQVSDDGNFCGVCPNCLMGYLHFKTITVYQRLPDQDGTQVYVDMGGYGDGPEDKSPYERMDPVVKSIPDRRFPGRRQSLVIEFDCECCEGPGMSFYMKEHKGCLITGWGDPFA